MLIIRIILAFYALLMVLASLESLRKEPYSNRIFHGLNFSISLALLIVLLVVPGTYLVYPVALCLVGYQFLTCYRGWTTQAFHWQHHVVRFLITLILIVSLYLLR